MDFAALPPEVNSGLMYTGAGAGPMLAAATAWDAMAAELGSAAASYQAVVTGLGGEWRGPASRSMAAAAAPYAAWMNAAAGQAEQTAVQAKAAASAYETAFAMTVPPPVIAANRAQLAGLVASNLLGQNTPAIMATEAHYFQMWAQDAAAMYGYAGSSAAATQLASFTAPKQNTNPGGVGSQGASVLQSAGTSAVPQALQGLSQPLSSAAPTSMAAAGTSTTTGGLFEGGMSPGLAIDVVSAGFEVASVGPFGTVGLGGAFGGLAITLGSLAFPEGVEGLGALGGLGLVSDVVPAAGLAGGGGVGGVAATWASMGKASSLGSAGSLGSLSVPQAWAAAAPSAVGQVGLVSAEATVGVASAVAAGGAELPLGEMALAGMAGRALAGSAARGLYAGARTTIRERSAAPLRPPDDPPAPQRTATAVEIVAELRGLAELRDSGILSGEEFNTQRERLIDGLVDE